MIFYAYFFCCLSQNNYLCALIFSHLLNMQSHPTWVRGLKPEENMQSERQGSVAPYVGAWIETHHVAAAMTMEQSRTLRGCVD